MKLAPPDYGDLAAEWAAIDRGAGMAWLAEQRTISVRGDDRVEFLQGQLSNDIAALAEGEGCAAAALSVQGRVAAIVAVYRRGDVFDVVVEQDHLERCRERLEQFLVADDVELELTAAKPCLSLMGPQAKKVLAAAGIDSQAWPLWSIGCAELDGHPLTVRTRGELREVLIEIDVDEDRGAVLCDRLAACGAIAVGRAACEIVRVESGRAAYGVDVDDSHIAIEARLEWAIHFSKGCYVGQEVIERAVSRGRINHRLCLIATDAGVAVGDRIQGGGQRDVVTSVVCSPRHGHVCLAYVDADRAHTGVELVIDSGARELAGRILEWPR